MVIVYIAHLHRSECAESDMKCHLGKSDSFFLYSLKQFLRKMQSCRRSRRRTLILCVYGLIPVLILKSMCNIRRQRHSSKLVKYLLKDTVKLKLYDSVSLFHDIAYSSYKQTVTEFNHRTDLALFPRLYKAFPSGL